MVHYSSTANIVKAVFGSAVILFLVLGLPVGISVLKLFGGNTTVFWAAMAVFAFVFLWKSRRA